jgi:hypothetical protein
MSDPEMLLLRELQVDVDIPAGIDDDRLASAADEVGRTAKIAVQNLPKEQSESFPSNCTS